MLVTRLREFLVYSSIAASFIVWLPTQVKVWRTKSAKDFHVASFLLILWLQASSFIVARLDHSAGLQVYFAVNGGNVLLTLLMVLRFR